MATERMRRHRLWAALLTTLIFGSGVAVAAYVHSPAPDIRLDGYCWRVTTKSHEYRFDAAWRREGVRHVDGTPLETEHELSIRNRLRQALLDHLEIEGLHQIPQAGQDEFDSLRTLGYL